MVQSGTKWCEAYVVLLQNQTDYLTVVNILFINLKFLVIMKIKIKIEDQSNIPQNKVLNI